MKNAKFGERPRLLLASSLVGRMSKTKHEVMLSSSFADLREHREVVVEAMREVGLEPINMEHRPQPPSTDTLEASLKMVDEADGFVGLASHRYGTVKDDATRNPHGYSLTELEYRRAIARKIPMSMFVMSPNHMAKPEHIETSPEGIQKLNDWKQHIQHAFTYTSFDSLDDLRKRIRRDLAELKRNLDARSTPPSTRAGAATEGPRRNEQPRTVRAPELLAMPSYTPGHDFVGRTRELILLDEWAKNQVDTPVLLFEAIGGMGKSMLTWHWVRTRATAREPAFAGIFWYSFYERGAEMLDCLRHCLAYVSGEPLEEFRDWKTLAITHELLPRLQSAPWLVVLDGIERLLVAYHRIDAAQVRDEAVDEAKDPDAADGKIGRDAHDCIREDDQALLAQLAQCAPSKILMSSRIVPSALLNPAGELRPGVHREQLAGLDPSDAEAILRNAGVRGSSEALQFYLQKYFACHPLVVGVVAGLVRNYRKAPNDFERWSDDPQGGAEPHLKTWDIVQRRNHVLKVAFDTIEPEQRELLTYLALITDPCEFEVLNELNPYRSPPPDSVPPWPFEPDSDGATPEELTTRWTQAQDARKAHLHAVVQEADTRLTQGLEDLEQRGLLQWDRTKNTYDLHPVVRGYALDSSGARRAEVGERVANYFEQRRDPPYETSQTLHDLRHGLQVYHALVSAGLHDRAFHVLSGGLDTALFVNLQLPHEALRLLRPLFPKGWQSTPILEDPDAQLDALNLAGYAFAHLAAHVRARQLFELHLERALEQGRTGAIRLGLSNLVDVYSLEGLARAVKTGELALRLGLLAGEMDAFRACVDLASLHVSRGAFSEAELLWSQIASTRTPADRANIRAGTLQRDKGRACLAKGELSKAADYLRQSLDAAKQARDRLGVINSLEVLAELDYARSDLDAATETLDAGIRMLREGGINADSRLAGLALVKAKHGDRLGAQRLLERISAQDSTTFAQIHFELGEHEKSRKAALQAYATAWADGPPFAVYKTLQEVRALLLRLGEPEPELPEYDPNRIEPIHCERQVIEYIEALEAAAAKKKPTDGQPADFLKVDQ